MPDEASHGPDHDEALDFFEAERDASFERGRALFDDLVRYLVYGNGGGVLVILGITGAYATSDVDPILFALPVLAFVAGLAFAFACVMNAENRQADRANLASSLSQRLSTGKSSLKQALEEWNRFIERQGTDMRVPPRILILLSGLSFLVAVMLGLLVLDRIEPASTAAPSAAIISESDHPS